MSIPPRRRWWPAALLGLAALLTLYAGPLRTGFLNDDHLFLEQARTRPLLESLGSMGPLGNYYRPVARQLYFEALTPIAGGEPLVFHAVNFALFVAALVLLADLLAVFLPPVGVAAGLAWFALLPFQRVNLLWVSCSQDLLALLFALGALALFRRGRDRAAAGLYLLAVFSKESALPLPLVLAAWARWVEGAGWRTAVRRVLPCGAVALLWVAVTLAVWSRNGARAAPLTFAPGHFAAAYAHLVQTFAGLDNPHLFAPFRPRWNVPALLLLAPIGWWLWRSRPGSPAGPEGSAAPAPDATDRPRAPGVLRLAALWVAAFGFVTGPVAAVWSGYYYTLAAAGGALAAGWLARRLGAVGWVALVTVLLAVHGAAAGARAFAVREHPWIWTSHLTSFYFERAAALTDTLARQLTSLEPRPAPGTRFFFSTLPSWAGFQMGNGALIRSLYRDPTLASHFYSQFSDSTAGWQPVRFLYWDGRALAPLYDVGRTRDPFFQVGTDLLLFDRPAGAAHAFRRGLAIGGTPFDHLYWLGWAELLQGRRAAGEAAWSRAGLVEDSLVWHQQMRIARQALNDHGDTLTGRRALLGAVVHGPGRPEAHAVLGVLLLAERPKYGLLELKVACWLKPDDWLARRDLVVGLVGQRLDQAARNETGRLMRSHPNWRSDSTLVSALRTLEARERAPAVVEF